MGENLLIGSIVVGMALWFVILPCVGLFHLFGLLK